MAESKSQPINSEKHIKENDPNSVLEGISPIAVCTSDILTNQMLNHYRDIQVLEAKLREILDIQKDCINELAKENSRFKDIYKGFNFNAMFSQISLYTKKLNRLRNDMTMIQDRVSRLKQRSTSVKEYQDKKIQQIREAKLLQEERERLLTAKPVWEVNDDSEPRSKSPP